MNFEDQQRTSAEPSSGPSDLDDTLPSAPVPEEFRVHSDAHEPTEELESSDPRSLGQERSPSWAVMTADTSSPLSARNAPASNPSRVLVGAIGLCLVLSLLSLALSGFLLYRLLTVRQTVAEGLDAAITALEGLGGDGLYYEYRFQQAIPVSADIPIEQELFFPFRGSFPINTAVEVPINTGILGTIVVEVPIDTSVYVSTSVPIHVDETFHVSTTIPMSMTIPIDLQAEDPALQGFLGRVLGWLAELRASF